MEAYDPRKVFSSIDQQGRYAYSNQPHAAHWNLMRLAEALLPLLEQEDGGEEAALHSANEALAAFGPQYEAAHLAGLRRKLGLSTELDGDADLAHDLLQRMAANHADFTLTFRWLCEAAAVPRGGRSPQTLFADAAAYDTWANQWHRRLERETVSAEDRAAAMRKVNPIFIPRNHLVEATIVAAVEQQNFQPLEDLLEVVSRPYEDGPGLGRYATPAKPEEAVLQTFCGT
jgi:uncharacterized protein YdiU (UPF0061 family)